MTGQQDMNDRDLLDFPGAGELRAAGKVSPPSADTVAAALAAVRSAARQAQEGGGPAVELAWEPEPAVVAVRTWRRRLPVFVSVAAVVAIALGVAVQPWSDFGGERSSPAAQRTEMAPYWKVRTLEWARSSGKAQRPEGTHKTVWLSRNGTREQGANGLVRDYPAEVKGGMSYVICGNSILWDDLRKLPTDPAALRARLVGKATGDDAEEGLYNGIEELLTQSPAEPQLRAALFKVLTKIPGARVKERVKDSTGRSGTAVELDAGTWHRRLIIDAGTFHVLESVDTARNDGLSWGKRKLRAGDLIQRTTYLSVGPAREAPKPSERP
ncbi:CU044_5270 family protein [Streptomyces sp. NPDC059009]|uniref:CU044_5270 family protein n=1 Tax=Streptomyces sp. NPDC059009 TaxID=3346694 RepID=UPI0036CE65AD